MSEPETARRRNSMGIPAAFWPYLDARLKGDDNSPPSTVARIRRCVTPFTEGSVPEWCFLVLSGPVGIGKTAEACWFLDYEEKSPAEQRRNKWRHNWNAEAVDFRRFVRFESLARAATLGREAENTWASWKGLDRLLVDDVGAGRMNEYALQAFLNLLYERHAGGLPTLITTNLSYEEFLSRFAETDHGRLRDRLRQAGKFVRIGGASLRQELSLSLDVEDGE